MKYFMLFFIGYSLPALSGNSECKQDQSSKLEIFDESPYSYSIESSNYLFKIDGKSAQFKGVIDKEAVKRLFMYCTPLAVSCLKQESNKESFKIDLKFKVSEEDMQPEELLVRSKNLSSEVLKCLQTKWQNLEMPKPKGEATVQLSIEVSPTLD